MDEARLRDTRSNYESALDRLRSDALDTEAEIGAEALVLLGLHGPRTSQHFYGSQFSSRTWMYAIYLDDQSRTARLEVATSTNDRLGAVAGDDAEPRRMLVFLDDAPALLQHVRRRVDEIRHNIDGPEPV